MDRRARNRFIAVQLCAVALILLYPLYGRITDTVPVIFRGCILHDLFHVYCPTCGGTRALEAMLRLDILQAIRFNALVVLLVLALFAWNVLALIRLLRGEKALYRIPVWSWIAVGGAILLFGIVRNVLMIAWGIDPLGDLLIFWKR